jgi:OOP family OmpA-OmpF porin
MVTANLNENHGQNKPMRLLLLLNFLFFFNSSFCQIKKISYDYNNGRIQVIGKIITCPNYDKKYPFKDSVYRKIGKWVYYYQNGNIKKIERYKKISDCNSKEIADGIWQKFDEQGLLINQEEFKDGMLWTADISNYYFKDQLAGQIQVRYGILDTLKYIGLDSVNLIKNGDFNWYLGPPQLQISDGQNPIENQIPFWISPDANTPDYYNQYRILKNVPDNLGHDYNAIYNYFGIILYHEPTGYYSEYITGGLNSQLAPNGKYCLKISIRLSQNAGYYIDKFGVYFSGDIPSISNTATNQKVVPQILFNTTLDNRDKWVTLCAPFIASGNEKYVTFGRFSGLSETNINSIKPINQSEGEYNQSAYYLIDKIELLKDTTECNCDNKSINRVDFDLVNPLDSIKRIINETFILKNIFFDFDKSDLLPASYNELEKLFNFLKINNVSITLSGHTDNIGSEEYNKTLSLSRAEAVADWLIAKGIDKKRIQFEGFGAKMPIVDNNSDGNRAINRRVEFKITKQ